MSNDSMQPDRATEDGFDVSQQLVEGRQRFLGLDLLCGPGALVPRLETELLGAAAIELGKSLNEPRVIDMCCGAGNLACAIASHLPSSRVWASDLTDGCVEWTRRNVTGLQLASRVAVVQGDLFAGLAGQNLEHTIDIIVCNPPYISTSRLAGDRASLLQHEPREAFDGGPYGLSIHSRVIKDAPEWLKPGGWLLFELGLGQDRQVKVLFDRSRTYSDVSFLSDELGSLRVARGRFTPR